MLYAYDLDGTIADTRGAVLSAYRTVGVEPPEDFFGKPYRSWLHGEDADELHRQKNLVYLGLIQEGLVRPTNMVYILRNSPGIILTGASLNAASAVINHLVRERYLLSAPRIYSGLSLEQKLEMLNRLSPNGNGIFFDDDLTTVQQAKERTKWTICHVL